MRVRVWVWVVLGAGCGEATTSHVDGAAARPGSDVDQPYWECAGDIGNCAQFCGSDNWFQPICRDGVRRCPGDTVDVDSCPPGLCWGPPYGNHACDDGKWVCPEGLVEVHEDDCVEPKCENLADAFARHVRPPGPGSVQCVGDADCTLVPASETCAGFCAAAVRADRAASHARVLAAYEQEILVNNGFAIRCACPSGPCPSAVACVEGTCTAVDAPPPACPEPAPAHTTCAGGHRVCAEGFWAVDPNQGCAPLVCDDIAAQYAELAVAADACGSDADCELVAGLGCSHPCQVAIAKAAEAGYAAQKASLDVAICKATEGFDALCTPEKTCPGKAVAVCQAGHCTTEVAP